MFAQTTCLHPRLFLFSFGILWVLIFYQFLYL